MDDSKICNSTYPQTQQTSWGSKLLGRTKDVGMEGHARELAPGSMKVKAPQLCPTHCDLPASSVHGILQARILEWVAYPFSRWSLLETLQADSLPFEPPGKPRMNLKL